MTGGRRDGSPGVSFSFEGELWRYPGDGAWYFITLPVDHAVDIKVMAEGQRKGFGSLRVESTIGAESWRTSIFPDAKTGSYLLPIKKEIRQKCGIEPGDHVTVELTLVDL